jgi:hypothetical protein
MVDSIKIDVDSLDEMRESDKITFKKWGYNKCEIYLWQGQLCFSANYVEELILTLKGKKFNKVKVINDLKEALEYKNIYQHLGLR